MAVVDQPLLELQTVHAWHSKIQKEASVECTRSDPRKSSAEAKEATCIPADRSSALIDSRMHSSSSTMDTTRRHPPRGG